MEHLLTFQRGMYLYSGGGEIFIITLVIFDLPVVVVVLGYLVPTPLFPLSLGCSLFLSVNFNGCASVLRVTDEGKPTCRTI